jgi:pimeloyl-ACP methyl ester carboxylesterase
MMKLVLRALAVLAALIIVVLGGAYLALRGPTIPYAELEARWATPASHHADLGEGIRVHYREDGPKDAPVLILVHGYGDSHFTWEGWTPILSRHYRLIALDLPGHGLTEAPPSYILRAADLADLVAKFAKTIGAEHFSIAGNSLGGGVAWLVAARHPEQVDALILDAAAGWPQPPAAGSPSLAFRILSHPLGRELLKHIDNKPLIRQGVRGEVGDPSVITDAFIDRWAALQRAPGHRDILLDIDMASVFVATPESVGAIKAPTLILQGETDPLIHKASAEKFAGAIAGSRLILYPGIGHLPQVEIPQKTAQDVDDFLGGALKSAP